MLQGESKNPSFFAFDVVLGWDVSCVVVAKAVTCSDFKEAAWFACLCSTRSLSRPFHTRHLITCVWFGFSSLTHIITTFFQNSTTLDFICRESSCCTQEAYCGCRVCLWKNKIKTNIFSLQHALAATLSNSEDSSWWWPWTCPDLEEKWRSFDSGQGKWCWCAACLQFLLFLTIRASALPQSDLTCLMEVVRSTLSQNPKSLHVATRSHSAAGV